MTTGPQLTEVVVSYDNYTVLHTTANKSTTCRHFLFHAVCTIK